MSIRLLVSFLVGAAFFTVLPIYAPFVVLQSEEMPRFLLGLGVGVVAGAVLALINGAARGLLLVLACAFVGASIYVFAYFVPRFSEGAEGLFVLPSALLFALAYLVLPAAVGWALAVLASSLLARRGRAVHQTARVPTPEADVSVPPPPRQPPTVAAGEGFGASPARRRRRSLAVLLLIGAIILAGIVGFVSTLVMNLRITGGTVADNIGFSVAAALSNVVSGAIIAVLVMLLGGGVVYLLDRDRRGSANTRITFLQAALSWQVLVIAAGLVFLMSLSDVASVPTVQIEEPPVERPPSRP
jgi:hypothetical protein